jgi:hypothetical protein
VPPHRDCSLRIALPRAASIPQRTCPE